VNELVAVTAYARGGELADPALIRSALHPDVVLRSPLSDRVRFAGADAVLEVVTAALGAFDGLRHHTELGDDRTRVLLASGRVDGVPFDETTVLRLADDGRIAEIALAIRPLPAAAAVLRALGGRLLAAQGRPAAGRAVRLALTPLVGLTRLADRMAGSVAG
jgi:SnoaL-like protein